MAESAILQTCCEIVKIMFGEEFKKQVLKILMSNNTFCGHITDISDDFGSQIIELLEVTVFKLTFSYFLTTGLSWQTCLSVCTDGCQTMTGHFTYFLALAKKHNPEIIVTHRFLHREALIAKSFVPELEEVLQKVIKVVNNIKSRPLKSRLFTSLCSAMETTPTQRLLHIEVILGRVQDGSHAPHLKVSQEHADYSWRAGGALALRSNCREAFITPKTSRAPADNAAFAGLAYRSLSPLRVLCFHISVARLAAGLLTGLMCDLGRFLGSFTYRCDRCLHLRTLASSNNTYFVLSAEVDKILILQMVEEERFTLKVSHCVGSEPMSVIDMSMEQCRNEEVGETGDP
ncbi:hypothetical protein PR048_015498 [Dryococelus australis]|uniref:Uncharacterized protein n=1 Tax=Dryococelus australis TaxID=614101 RepID=A0ABQ9HHE1_9NEOP|nr:hypothetical protein PR048_015498 [Dryococelus australis]